MILHAASVYVLHRHNLYINRFLTNAMKHTVRDLERELRGVTLAGKALSAQLVASLGTQNALHWYYQTIVPEFAGVTPHAYVARHGKRGKERLAGEIYALLTGQPE